MLIVYERHLNTWILCVSTQFRISFNGNNNIIKRKLCLTKQKFFYIHYLKPSSLDLRRQTFLEHLLVRTKKSIKYKKWKWQLEFFCCCCCCLHLQSWVTRVRMSLLCSFQTTRRRIQFLHKRNVFLMSFF